MSERLIPTAAERLLLPAAFALSTVMLLSGCEAVSHALESPSAPATIEASHHNRHHKTVELTPSPTQLPKPTALPTSALTPELSPSSQSPAKTHTTAEPTRKPNAEPTYQPLTAMPEGLPRFWPTDSVNTWYTSPWYKGAHPVMVGYGCTKAPYYDADPTCPKGEGKHHGIDVEMPCGTPLYADMKGEVVPYGALGAPGMAYGRNALRIRGHVPGNRGRVDVIIGHTRHDLVAAGDSIDTGELISHASDDGAPDGCHLHFEVRPVGRSYRAAVDPSLYLKLAKLPLD
jgi:murein DD-endopeptidase MepM/ murein hydrolase activator NlpD